MRLARRITLLLVALLSLATASAQGDGDPPPPGQVGLDTTQRDSLEAQIEAEEARLQARRAEIAAIEAELGETRERLDTQIVERDRVVAQISDIRSELDTIRNDIVRREAELQQTQARIAARTADLGAMQTRIQQLLLDLYRQRSNRFARVLANADSFHDLRVQNRYLALISEQDARIVDDLNAILADLADLQATLSQQITDLQTREDDRLQALINELDATREGQLAQQRALLQSQGDLELLISGLVGNLEAEIADLDAQATANREAAIEFLRVNPPAPLGSPAAGTACADAAPVALPAPLLASGFIFPFEGARISRPFGQDNLSYLGLTANQAGAPVRTVQEGQVTRAVFLTANDGYLVVVQHNDGVATSYLNLREPLVREGDQVVQGQLIGCLGGGALNPEDLLKLYVSFTREGRTVQIDPVIALGLNP
jgi:murein DD-endopeptidase MepM/ murein hydrolase activator NlpD